MASDWLNRILSRSQDVRTAWGVVKWWELIRFAYNLVVGAAGLVSLTTAIVVASILESKGQEHAIFPDPPIFAFFIMVLYGFMANACYTAGWICELVARKWWPAEAPAFGRLSFIFGLSGSGVVTLLPGVAIILFSLPGLFARNAFHH